MLAGGIGKSKGSGQSKTCHKSMKPLTVVLNHVDESVPLGRDECDKPD